jgi:hypothetical protein
MLEIIQNAGLISTGVFVDALLIVIITTYHTYKEILK